MNMKILWYSIANLTIKLSGNKARPNVSHSLIIDPFPGMYQEIHFANGKKYCKLKDEIEWEGGVTKGKARLESVSHSQLEF